MQFWFAALAASPLPKESTLAPSAQMSPEWHNAFSKADANKDGSLTYHEFATIAGAQVGLLAVGKGKGTAMEFCAPGQKKIESCVDDKLDFVFEGGCAKGFHTVPSRTRSPRSPSPLLRLPPRLSVSRLRLHRPLLSTSGVHHARCVRRHGRRLGADVPRVSPSPSYPIVAPSSFPLSSPQVITLLFNLSR